MVKPFDFFICDFQKKVNTFVYILLLAQLNTAFLGESPKFFEGLLSWRSMRLFSRFVYQFLTKTSKYAIILLII